MENNKKLRRIITRGLVASTFILSTNLTTVFADEDGGEITTTTETMEDVQVDSNLNPELLNEQDLEQPGLVPGDFFYFAKAMLEKIRLAFTFDDYKEAQLLADFAAERIAEANALITAGKTEEAQALLNEAIETQELANDTSSNNEEEENANANADSEDVNTENDGVTQLEMPTTTSTTTETEVVALEDEEADDELDGRLANNIDALLMVLEKIDNPRAQEAIMKNIQKSFAKLDKKMSKLEDIEISMNEKLAEIEAELASGEISEEEAREELDELREEANSELEAVEEEENEENEETEESEESEESEEAEVDEEEKDVAKEVAKEKAEEKREAAKEKREAAKEKAEEKREAAKEKAEEKRENNKNKRGE